MSYVNEGAGDLEKLKAALSSVAASFGSADAVLEALGLSDMPQAQRYGILFGVVVFVLTLASVMALLVLGGSFRRLVEQAETGNPTLLRAHDARAQRALLLEELLEGRERMLAENCPKMARTEKTTNLTKMLLNVGPRKSGVGDGDDDGGDSPNESKKIEDEDAIRSTNYPPFYVQNYEKAYRKCQDRPGGT